MLRVDAVAKRIRVLFGQEAADRDPDRIRIRVVTGRLKRVGGLS
jgi:hypothetical protein